MAAQNGPYFNGWQQTAVTPPRVVPRPGDVVLAAPLGLIWLFEIDGTSSVAANFAPTVTVAGASSVTVNLAPTVTMAGSSSVTVNLNPDLFMPTVRLLVDWTNTGTYVDESVYVRALSYSRGRAAVNDVFAAGSATLRLRNESGRFGPYNAASPLSPNVAGGRPVIITANYQNAVYAQWAGYTDEFSETELMPNPEVTLHCLDAFNLFSRSKAAVSLQVGQTTDAIVTAILAAFGWTGGASLEAGRVLPTYAQLQKSVLQALQDVALNELGGAVFMGKDGSVVFQNAGHRAAAVSSFTLSGGIENLTLDIRQSDLVDRVRLTYGGYTLTTAVGSLYSGNQNRQLPAQAYTTFSDSLASAAVTMLATPVPYTDFTASDGSLVNPYTGGGNLDVTDSVWLETFTVSGGQFTATFYNSLPYTVQLSGFGVRGTGVQTVSNPPVHEVDVGAPQVTNQPYELTIAWVTDYAAIQAFATARAAALGSQHPRPVVTVVGRTPALMAFLLGVDLSQRITLVDNAGPWQSGLNGDFFVEHVDLSIAPGQIPTATLGLFDLAQGTPA